MGLVLWEVEASTGGKEQRNNDISQAKWRSRGRFLSLT